MIRIVVLLFLSLTISNCESLGNNEQSVLQQISDVNSECNNNQLFGSFELENVPQFGAMCNIQIPNTNTEKILLNNNVIPILCMGMFDATLRLCKSAVNDTTPFKDVLPPTIDKFALLFTRLSSEEYSSLDTFCSHTVKKCSISEPANNKTEFWWTLLNRQLNDKASCMDICRTNENNRVHPLCSYIVWSNGIVINYYKNKVESLGTLGLVGDAEDEFKLKTPEYSTSKIIQGQEYPISPGVMSSAISAASGSVLHQVEIEPPSVPSLVQVADVIAVPKEIVNTNITSDKLTEEAPTNAWQNPVLPEDIKSSAAGKSIPKAEKIKSTANSKNNSDLSTSVSQMKPTKENNVNNSSVINKPPVANLSDISASEGLKVVPEPNNGPAADQEVNYNEAAPDQVIGSNKDIDIQLPLEDGTDIGFGEDDVDLEQEDPEKTTPTQKGPNKIAAEPDKVYSEGDREVLMVDPFVETEDSHFFTYFICMSVLTIMAYLAFHNKKKLIALAVEGRRTRHTRQRPNSSFYSKLDCNLEEAMISNSGKASVTHVLY